MGSISMAKRGFLGLLVILLCQVVGVNTLTAQTNSATVTGNVTDQSSASVPLAQR